MWTSSHILSICEPQNMQFLCLKEAILDNQKAVLGLFTLHSCLPWDLVYKLTQEADVHSSEDEGHCSATHFLFSHSNTRDELRK